LDNILGGGFVRGRLHLVEGKPGTGKTTLAMQFILAGRDQSEPVLYVSMSETRRIAIGSERSRVVARWG